MKDYYKIMGLSPSASHEKIRSAYRTLARRYHPDVNPGKSSAEKFKEIAEAYNVLKSSERRRKYDREYAAYQYQKVDARVKAYRNTQEQEQKRAADQYYREQRKDYEEIKRWQRPAGTPAPDLSGSLRRAARALFARFAGERGGEAVAVRQLSVIELSISMREAVFGTTRTVSVEGGGSRRTLKVRVQAGAKSGGIVRMRVKSHPAEEVLCIIKLERLPGIALEQEGLVIDLPVTVHEAIAGATVAVPTFEEPVMVKIQPGTQSGAKIRVKGKGIAHPDGAGDLFVRVMIQVPESDLAVGIKEKSAELNPYYENPVRARLPKNLNELLAKEP